MKSSLKLEGAVFNHKGGLCMSGKIKKLGRTAYIIIPATLRRKLNLKAEDLIDISIFDNAIVIQPIFKKPRYKLKDLLEKRDASHLSNPAIKEWDNSAPIGKELI